MTTVLLELRGLLPTLLMPFRLSLLLIGIGFLLRRRAAILAGFVLLYLASAPVIADSLRLWLENRYPRLEAAQCPAADAVVVLSGYAEQDRRHPGEIRWTDRTDRFQQGLRLFRLQKAPILLFTDSQPPLLSGMVRQAAVDQGVPSSAVQFTAYAGTTADEAVAVRDYLRDRGAHRIILVTSALHMGRAALLFRRAGVDFVPFPVDYQSDGWVWSFSNFLPFPGALNQTEQSFHEIYGNLAYRFR